MKRILVGLLLIAAQPAAAQEDTAPCDAPPYRQFDFWVGRFEVRTVDGALAGHNRIEPLLGRCALGEHWTGARGGQGRSINFYDRSDQRWHQVWIDDQGRPLYLAGGIEDGAMVLSGETRTADGTTTQQRITWRALPDGRVRQHWESSADDGATWRTVFDGYYSHAE